MYLHSLENCQAHLSGNSFPCCLGQGRAGVGLPSQRRTSSRSPSRQFAGDWVSGRATTETTLWLYAVNGTGDAKHSVEATGLIRARQLPLCPASRSLADFLVPSCASTSPCSKVSPNYAQLGTCWERRKDGEGHWSGTLVAREILRRFWHLGGWGSLSFRSQSLGRLT